MRAGALTLWRAAPWLAPGVILAVVDPGVGTRPPGRRRRGGGRRRGAGRPGQRTPPAGRGLPRLHSTAAVELPPVAGIRAAPPSPGGTSSLRPRPNWPWAPTSPPRAADRPWQPDRAAGARARPADRTARCGPKCCGWTASATPSSTPARPTPTTWARSSSCRPGRTPGRPGASAPTASSTPARSGWSPTPTGCFRCPAGPPQRPPGWDFGRRSDVHRVCGGHDPAASTLPPVAFRPWLADRRIPEATVARLPLYLRALDDAARERTVTISSEALAAASRGQRAPGPQGPLPPGVLRDPRRRLRRRLPAAPDQPPAGADRGPPGGHHRRRQPGPGPGQLRRLPGPGLPRGGRLRRRPGQGRHPPGSRW